MSKGKNRNQAVLKQERARINRMFDELESDFADNFWTPYEQHASRIGQPFTVTGRVTEEDADLECLPMWYIRFEDGEEIQAWPEEIISSEIAACNNSIAV